MYCNKNIFISLKCSACYDIHPWFYAIREKCDIFDFNLGYKVILF